MNTRYGRLVVLDPHQRGERVLCQCDCGKLHNPLKYKLRSGATTSCGCWKRDRLAGKTHPSLIPTHERPAKIEKGIRVGRLTTTTDPYGNGGKNRVIDVTCDCGTQKTIVAGHLGKKINSCGCLKVDTARNIQKS